jgi:hypothetical protein
MISLVDRGLNERHDICGVSPLTSTIWSRSSVVERQPVKLRVVGSIPTGASKASSSIGRRG